MTTIRSFLLCLLCVATFIIHAQDPMPVRTSPLALVTAKSKDTYLKVTYGQPQKKGREIFGKLVPFGQVWRTGANEATEMTITRDIIINSILLKAGTYSIFTIPQNDHWTIIINSELGLWGSYNYNSKLDVFRFDVPVKPADKIYEAFTLSIDQRNELADLIMQWDSTKISIPIKFIN